MHCNRMRIVSLLPFLIMAIGFLLPAHASETVTEELTLEQWTYEAMVKFAPPEKAPQFPGYEETIDETKQRYRELAAVIAKVGENRSRAALLVAIGIGESRLARDTDVGPCYRGKPGGKLWKRCDSGTSGSVWQIKTPVKGLEGEVISYTDIFKDRERAARIELRIALGSLRRCRHLEPVDHLSALGGSCQAGLASAQSRWKLWQTISVWSPPK